MDESAEYPNRWETHAILKDGSTVEIRPIKASDRDALDAFHKRQSHESIYFRFFRYRPELSDKELDYFTQVDYQDRMAFVALLGSELVAVARYEKWKERNEAEVAFFVDDQNHGKGLGTLMLEYLAAAARERGLGGFTASVLPENYRMLGVFRSAGFDVSTRFADGLIEVELGIEVTAETSTAIADRHRRARARSVDRLLRPGSVAVIGASSQPGTVGHELVRSLLGQTGAPPFQGRVHAINPNATEVAGLATHPTIGAAAADRPEGPDGPEGIDLAVIAVRAELVEQVVQECAEAGVDGLIVISAGFSETGDAGRERERRIVDLARDNGMRLIGPNAFGVVNNDESVSLNALFHQVGSLPGSVAMASQSGPLGAAVLERLRSHRVGISSFVGIGNRADVSVNDLLDYWHEDEATDVVVLYVENYGNLRNFAAAASSLAADKPVAAIEPSDRDLAELLRQSGVIIVDEVAQLVDQAVLASTQPAARGNRVAIVSNAASIGRLAASACRRNGLEVVVPASAADVEAGAEQEHAVLVGDLDTVSLMPSGDRSDYERVIVAAAVSDEVDLLLIALAPTAYLGRTQVRRLLNRVNRSIDKPVAAIGLINADELVVEGLPVFSFPEEAARVLGRHASYGRWLAARSEAGPMATPDPEDEPPELEALLDGADERVIDLADPDFERLAEALNLPVAPYGVVTGRAEVAAAADRVGYPLVMKAGNLDTRSIGEGGGAAIDLHDADEVTTAYDRMSERLGSAMRVAVVQRMVGAATAARLELTQDPVLGSMVTIGLGGSLHQAAPPAGRRFVPFDRVMAEELVAMLEIDGRTSDHQRDGVEVLVALALHLGELAGRCPRLARVTLNPIMLAGTETMPVDIEIELRSPAGDRRPDVRQL